MKRISIQIAETPAAVKELAEEWQLHFFSDKMLATGFDDNEPEYLCFVDAADDSADCKFWRTSILRNGCNQFNGDIVYEAFDAAVADMFRYLHSSTAAQEEILARDYTQIC